MPLNRAEAERAIVREWDVWAANPQNSFHLSEDMRFFYYLQRKRADLLDFRYAGDKYQAVHGTLLSAERVT
jgi:hypothetical protein